MIKTVYLNKKQKEFNNYEKIIRQINPINKLKTY